MKITIFKNIGTQPSFIPKTLISVFIFLAVVFLLFEFTPLAFSAFQTKSNTVVTIVGDSPVGGDFDTEPFTALPGCVAARNKVPIYAEQWYPRLYQPGNPLTVTTCGPTTGTMILASLGILDTSPEDIKAEGTKNIETVTLDWERDGAWSIAGFVTRNIPTAVNNSYSNQGIRAEYRGALKTAREIGLVIQETKNPVFITAYYDNNATGNGLGKNQTFGYSGKTSGGISFFDGKPGHAIVVYQVCPNRVYINDSVLGEIYDVPVSDFEKAINIGYNRGETIAFVSTGRTSTPASSPVPSVAPTIKPTARPTTRTSPSPTRSPSSRTTPTPTINPTPSSQTTAFDIRINLEGIGGANGNLRPLRTNRKVLFRLHPPNKPLGSVGGYWFEADLQFDSVSGQFKSTPKYLLNPSLAGDFLVRASTPGYLETMRLGHITIIKGESAVIDNLTLIAGDINGDSKIDMIDYGYLESCLGARVGERGSACTADMDFNDDGWINDTDEQLWNKNAGL